MKHQFLFVVLIILVAIIDSCNPASTPGSELKLLDTDWQFARLDSGHMMPAKVPGCVHLDLMTNGVIEDPYYRLNEADAQWVEKYDWVYECHFNVTSKELKYNRSDLVFEGLDTYADIYLNENLIMSADNMFRTWEKEVKGNLRKGTNELRVVFHSPIKIIAEKAAKLPYHLPDERAWSRKAPYSFGWDWGPRLVTSGIWKPVYLRFWNDVRIVSLHIIQNKVGKDRAEMMARIEVEAQKNLRVAYQLEIPHIAIIKGASDLLNGINEIEIPFTINDPKLWWTRELGEQNLYSVNVSLLKGKDTIAIKNEQFGIRTVEVVQEADSKGKSFFIKLNGQPVFMKGANYIPEDNFLPRMDLSRYEKIIQSASEANMNMLRVWGGGIYEDNIFYDLCDEYGILVWQDFMFAGTMYPGDSLFLQNVKSEVEEQVSRLRNHPCIALWCGNNEIDEGWHNWGWQKQFGYTPQDSAEIWNAYINVFHEILPDVIKQYDGSRFYWPSSPKIGWGHPEAMLEGDMHYWGVWWGKQPFSIYEQKVGRFMSEYGFQGYPDLETIRWFTVPGDRQVGSPVMKAHQKHPFGDELIQSYMKREYKVPTGFEDYVYVSQVNQAEGIRKAIEAHRRNKPYCMGTLFWQLNDCWPVISWSAIDYFYRWKALNYFAKKAYEKFLISAFEENNKIRIYIISDAKEDLPAQLKIELSDFNGNVLLKSSASVVIKANSSPAYYETPLATFLQYGKPNELVLRTELTQDSSVMAEDLHYFVPVKDLSLHDPGIHTESTRVGEGFLVRLTAASLVKNLCLETPGIEGHFSDNYFDLFPGETRVIQFIPAANIHSDSLDIKIRSINLIKLNM